MSTCHLIIHDQAALLASLSLVAGSVVENTICAEKEEEKNKGAGAPLVKEMGMMTRLLPYLKLNLDGEGAGSDRSVARSGRVRPPSPKRIKTPTTCLCAVERGTSFKMTVLSLSLLINQSLAFFCGGGSLCTPVFD